MKGLVDMKQMKKEIEINTKLAKKAKIESMARDIVIRSNCVHHAEFEPVIKNALAKAAAFYDTCEKINFDKLPKIVYKKGE